MIKILAKIHSKTCISKVQMLLSFRRIIILHFSNVRYFSLHFCSRFLLSIPYFKNLIFDRLRTAYIYILSCTCFDVYTMEGLNWVNIYIISYSYHYRVHINGTCFLKCDSFRHDSQLLLALHYREVYELTARSRLFPPGTNLLDLGVRLGDGSPSDKLSCPSVATQLPAQEAPQLHLCGRLLLAEGIVLLPCTGACIWFI